MHEYVYKGYEQRYSPLGEALNRGEYCKKDKKRFIYCYKWFEDGVRKEFRAMTLERLREKEALLKNRDTDDDGSTQMNEPTIDNENANEVMSGTDEQVKWLVPSVEIADYRIYTTSDYAAFKILKGNRGVDGRRVKLIRESIEKVGWIRNPIIVNEKMEIIDGQGRFEALKERNLPIDFIMDEGTGVDECVSMNIHQQNWKLQDYINSFVELGVKDYVYLNTLLEDFPKHALSTVLYCVTGNAARGGGGQNAIPNGEFECSKERYLEACEKLRYLDGIFPSVKKIKGGRSYFEIGVTYCVSKGADKFRMSECIDKYCLDIPNVASVESAVAIVEDIYNRKRRNKESFLFEYKNSEKGRKNAKNAEHYANNPVRKIEINR